MIRTDYIADKLLHLVGWQQGQSYNLQIDSRLTITESGLYFQQAHPLITLENIRSIAPEFTTVDGSESSFDTWLEAKTKASIVKAVSRFCTEKANTRAYKALCENTMLFTGTSRLRDKITNANALVGFEITPIRSRGISTAINRIGFFADFYGTVDVYIYHSSQELPVFTYQITVNANAQTWTTLPSTILRQDEYSQGSWYVVYRQASLGGQVINANYDWSKRPCRSCSATQYALHSKWSPYLEVHPFYVPAGKFDDSQDLLWDIKDNVYTPTMSYGLNLDVTVACDISDFIVEQRSLFTDVIMKQLAVDMLREFAYNPAVRTNRHSLNASRAEILYELDGDSSSMKKSGLVLLLDEAYKALSISFAGQDRVCLPCGNNGIKYYTT